MSILARLKLRSASFRRDEDGAATTVEACLWTPFFTALLLVILNFTTIFMNESRVLRLVQDANRHYITGKLKTLGEVELWLENRLAPIDPAANATLIIVGGNRLETTVDYTLNSQQMRAKAVNLVES